MTDSINDPVAADSDAQGRGPGVPRATGTATGQAATPGQTAGLPGENASPDVVQFSDSERASTVDMGGTPSGASDDDPSGSDPVAGSET